MQRKTKIDLGIGVILGMAIMLVPFALVSHFKVHECPHCGTEFRTQMKHVSIKV